MTIPVSFRSPPSPLPTTYPPATSDGSGRSRHIPGRPGIRPGTPHPRTPLVGGPRSLVATPPSPPVGPIPGDLVRLSFPGAAGGVVHSGSWVTITTWLGTGRPLTPLGGRRSGIVAAASPLGWDGTWPASDVVGCVAVPVVGECLGRAAAVLGL
jgi:hypothetical protein